MASSTRDQEEDKLFFAREPDNLDSDVSRIKKRELRVSERKASIAEDKVLFSDGAPSSDSLALFSEKFPNRIPRIVRGKGPLTGQYKDFIGMILLSRYEHLLNLESGVPTFTSHGEIGGTRSYHMSMGGDMPLLRAKYLSSEEIWNLVFFERFLEKYGLRGSLTLDWGPSGDQRPQYIVMREGRPISNLVQGKGLDDILKALSDFYFPKNEFYVPNGDNTRQVRRRTPVPDLHGERTKQHIDFVILSLARFVHPDIAIGANPDAGPIPSNILNVNDLRNIYTRLYDCLDSNVNCYFTPTLPELYHEHILSKDGRLQFIDQRYGIRAIDHWQSWRKYEENKDMLTWFMDRESEGVPDPYDNLPFDESALDVFWGTPHFGLGSFNFGVSADRNITNNVKAELRGVIDMFIDHGRFGPKDNPHKRGWDHKDKPYTYRLVLCGGLWRALDLYYRHYSDILLDHIKDIKNRILKSSLEVGDGYGLRKNGDV